MSSPLYKPSDSLSEGAPVNVMSVSVHGSAPQLQPQSPSNSSVSSRFVVFARFPLL